MKFLLATLSTLSIGSPIISTTANAIEISPNAYTSDVRSGENLVGLGKGSNQALDQSLGHAEKLKYQGDNEDTNTAAESNDVYVSNNYTITPNAGDMMSIDQDLTNLDKPDIATPTFYTTVNQFNLENKTFMPVLDAGKGVGHLVWIGQAQDEDTGIVSTYQRQTPIQFKSDTKQKFTPFATPFTYFDSANKNKRLSYILSSGTTEAVVGTTTNLSYTKVNNNSELDNPILANDTNNPAFVNAGSDENLGEFIDDGDGVWNVSTFFAQNFDTYSTKLETSGLLNKVIVGFYNDTQKRTRFYAFDTTVNGDSLELTPNDTSRYLETDDTTDKFRLSSTLDGGDILFKTGSGAQATYALASYLTDGETHESHTEDAKIKKGSDVLKALHLPNDAEVANMFSSSDHQLMFVTSQSIAQGFDNKDFYYVGLGDTSKELTFTTSNNLFSTDEYKNTSDPEYKYMTGDANVVTGKVTDANGNIKYYFIATVSLQQKVIVYKYTNANQLTSTALGGINDSLDSSPRLETIYQTAGYLSGKLTANATSIAFVDNNFLISNASTVNNAPVPFVVTVSEKIDNNEIIAAIGQTVELTQSLYDSISASYPDYQKNSNAVRYAFMQALVTGHFVYSKEFAVYPFDDPSTAEYSNDDIWNNSIVGKLRGDFPLLIEALNNARFTVNGEIITSPFVSKTIDDSENGITIDVDGESLNNLVHYKQYGMFENESVLSIKTYGPNSFIKGSIEVKATSPKLNTSLDVNDINEQVREKIHADFSDYNINRYNTPGAVTGYIINKINEVIYDESRKYSSDKNIGKLLSDFKLNPAVNSNTDRVATGWNEYHNSFNSDDTSAPIYNDTFDGKRPFVLTTKPFYSEAFKDSVTEEKWRTNMDWGWQDTSPENQVVNPDNSTTTDLSNIVLTTETSAISVIRGSASVIKSDTRTDGILDYGDNKVSSTSILLNIGEDDKDMPNVNNHLRATVNTQELNKLINESTIQEAATADLDKAASQIKNVVVGGDDASNQTSLFRYFEKMRKEFDIAPDVQISLDRNLINNDKYFMSEGDNKKFDIVIYDAMFFTDSLKVDSKTNDIYDENFQKLNHFRIVSIYISNGQNKTHINSIIIFASVFGGVVILLFVSYTIYVSMRKSFYKHGTTREQAKLAAIGRKAMRHDKKNDTDDK